MKKFDAKNNNIRRPEIRKKKKHRALKVFLIIDVIIIALLLAVISGWSFIDRIYTPGQNPGNTPGGDPVTNETSSADDTSSETTAGNAETEESTPSNVKVRREGMYTFLFVGRDKVALNTDVIMLASFDINTSEITVLQIPRDTYIERWGSAKKLNSIFATEHNYARSEGSDDPVADGMIGLAEAISENTGIPIDFYVHIDLQGFRNIIDIIGGVDLYIPYSMYYEDPEQDLYISLPAGQTHLDGKKAEQFVRYRDGYATGDIGRVSAQRLFLSAAATQLKSRLTGLSAITTITQMADQAFKNVKTNLTALDFAYFAKAFLNVNTDNIKMSQLPGLGYNGYASYFGVNRSESIAIISEYFSCYTTPYEDTDFDPNGALLNSQNTKAKEIYYGEASGEDISNVNDIADDGMNSIY